MKNSPEHKSNKTLYPDQGAEENNEDSWQISYLDIITIVLGFLIILLSVSQFRKSPLPSLSTLYGKKSDESEFVTTPVDDLHAQLDSLLHDQIAMGNIEINRELNDLRIRFKGDDFYRSGNTSLEPKGTLILEEVLGAFQEVEYNDFRIDVEGHTDNAPIKNSSFASNWELSTARATNVVRYFRENGIRDKRLKASGFADSRPIIQYDSLGFPFAAAKDMNRRVVMRLYYTADDVLAANRDSIRSTQVSTQSEANTISDLASSLRRQARENPISESRQEPVVVDADTLTEPSAVPQQPQDQPSEEQVRNQESASVFQSLNNRSKAAPERVPSFFGDAGQCRFSVEAGRNTALSQSFQLVNTAENLTGLDFELHAVGEQFSARTRSFDSFDEALDTFRSHERSLNSLSLVHQCATGNEFIPEPLEYQIQFGAFQDEENALNFSLQMMDEYGIQAYMIRNSDTYNIVSGPYSSTDEVSERIQEFRNSGVSGSMFIRYADQRNIAYGYLYQIQIATASVSADLENVKKLVRDNSAVNGQIIRAGDSRFYLLTRQYRTEGEAADAMERVRVNNRQLSPVLYLLEYY